MQSFDRVGKTSVCLISARLIPKDRWESGNGGWWFQGFNTGKKMVALLINSVVSNRYNLGRAPRRTPNAKESNLCTREREIERKIGSSFLIGRDDIIDRCPYIMNAPIASFRSPSPSSFSSRSKVEPYEILISCEGSQRLFPCTRE